MKKLLFISAFCLASILSTKAQTPNGVKIGWQASPLVAWSSTLFDTTNLAPPGLTTKSAPGFSFGIIGQIPITGNFGLRTSLNFVNKKFITVGDLSFFNLGETENKITMNNLELIVTPQYSLSGLGSKQHLVVNFWTGISLDALLGYAYDANEIDMTTTPHTLKPLPTEKNEGRVTKINSSIVVGSSISKPVGNGTIEIGPSCHFGITNIADKDFQRSHGATRATVQSSKLSYVALDLGYFF